MKNYIPQSLVLVWKILRPVTPKGWSILKWGSITVVLYIIGAAFFGGMISDPDWKLWRLSPNAGVFEHIYAIVLSFVIAPLSTVVFITVTTVVMVMITLLSYFYLATPLEVEKCNPTNRLMALMSMAAFPAFNVEFWRIIHCRMVLQECLPIEVVLQETAFMFKTCLVALLVGMIIWTFLFKRRLSRF